MKNALVLKINYLPSNTQALVTCSLASLVRWQMDGQIDSLDRVYVRIR